MDQKAMTDALLRLKDKNKVPDAESNVYGDDFDDDAIINAVKSIQNALFQAAQDEKEVKKKPMVQQQKRPQSMPKKKPYQFDKLNDREKEKLFLDMYDENIKLKENQTKFEKMYGTMEVKLQQMQRYMGGGNKTLGAAEPNDQLASKVNNLETENEKLKLKIQAISQAQRVVVATGPKKKKLVQADRPEVEQMGIRGGQFVDQQNQIKQLLELNDKLKKRLLEQDAQFRQLQAMMNSKIVNQQELSQKNAQFVTLQERCNKLETQLQGMKIQLEEERKRQSEIMSLLREEKEKNHLLEGQVRAMELAQKSVNDLQADLQESRRSKKEIEERLAILMESPFFKEYNERATIQAKMKALEQEQVRNQTDLKNLRELNARLETENRLKKEDVEILKSELRALQEKNQELNIKVAEKDQQLLPFKDLDYWDNDQFLKVLGNLKWTGEDPVWRKIEFIDRTYMDSDDPSKLRKEIEHLKLEKGELAAHLVKTQSQLKTLKDIEMEKDKIHQTQLEQLKLELKAANEKAFEYAKIADLKTQARQQQTLYEVEGVKYDDSVSVFSVDRDELLMAGENYFDLWVGKGEYQPAELIQSYKIATQLNLDTASLLTFVTIDFYDHETQHTSVSEGTSCFYNLQISFKVDADTNFLQYLETNYLKLELFVSQGSEPTKIGSGLIQLKQLLQLQQNDTISKVIGGSLTIYGTNNQMIGIIEYKSRMRYPISNQIRLLKERGQLAIQEEQEEVIAVRKRKLVICIEKGTNFPPKGNCFIYYNFDAKDYHTNTQVGSTPRWDYRMVHEIVYNDLVSTQFKKQLQEFFIIDDNQPLVEGSNDKVGQCEVDMSALVRNEMIDLAAEIKNDDGDRIASLYIKIFWYDVKDDDTLTQQRSMITESWEENLTYKIRSELRSRGLVGITAFRVFDKDSDNIITFEDFVNGIKNVLSLKLSQQEMQFYYSKLPQPLNLQKFQEFYKLQSTESMLFEAGGAKSQYQTQDLSNINQFFQQNTQQLQKTQLEQIHSQIYDLFKRKMQFGKSIQELFKEIDSGTPDGQLTVEELQRYLQANNLLLPISQLREFLKFYMDINNDQLVNFKEFLNFFKLIPSNQQQQVYSQQSFRQQSNQRVSSNIPSMQDNMAVQQSPLDIAITTILNYAEARQWTLMQVREQIDQNRNSYIERHEMREFLVQFGVLQLLPNGEYDVDQIIGYFDKNRDGRISIAEFAETLSEYNNRQKIITNYPTQENIQNYVVGYLISYMQRYKKTLPELFNDIDQDQNGYLSKKELKQIFRQRITVPVDDYELEQLYSEFDSNRDGRISIQEFLTIVRPVLDKAPKVGQVQIKQAEVAKEQLLRKVEEICFKNAKLLQGLFSQQAPRPGVVPEQTFKQILRSQKVGFTAQEIDDIPVFIIKPENGLINYNAFLQLGASRGGAQQSDLFGQTARSGFGQLSQVEQERAILKAKEVFARIQKPLKNKFTSKQLFATFDIDGNGQINKKELTDVFTKMRLRIPQEDVDLIFKALDRDEDGSIDVAEFMKYIE